MRGPIAQIPTPVDLDKVLGRPTDRAMVLLVKDQVYKDNLKMLL